MGLIHQNKTHSNKLHCLFHFYDSHFTVPLQFRQYIHPSRLFCLFLFIYLLIIRYKRASRGEFNRWTEMHSDGKVRIIKVEHTQVWSSSTLINLLSINLKVVQLVAVIESRWSGASDTFCATVICKIVVSFTFSCHTYRYLERALTCKSDISGSTAITIF
jgi:hypothetical protein